jgi:hypothetical protein
MEVHGQDAVDPLYVTTWFLKYSTWALKIAHLRWRKTTGSKFSVSPESRLSRGMPYSTGRAHGGLVPAG